MNEILKDFPRRTAKALELLMDYDWYDTRFYSRGADVYAVLDDCGMMRITVILRDTGAQPWQELNCYDREMTRDGDGYRLTAEYFDEDAGMAKKLELPFRDVEVELEVFRVESNEWKPWELLAGMAREILFKAEFGEDLLNDRELELLPLLRELERLDSHSWWSERFVGFPELRKRFERFGFRELEKPLAKAEAVFGTKKWPAHMGRIRAKLNRVKYEPLWRELYRAITESQAEYPCRAECHPDFAAVKKKIESKFHRHGYKGKYPDFYKEGEVCGLRIVESYGQSWLICNEKRAVSHIHCEGSVYFDELLLSFRCGTELLKGGQEPGDIHRCRFDSKGRTILRTVFYSANKETNLQQHLAIAMKRAELRKLSKAEQKIDGDANLLGIALVWLILGGGFFALTGMAALAVFGTAALWATEGLSAAIEMMGELPWGGLTAFAWLGFGGSMALVTILAKRN